MVREQGILVTTLRMLMERDKGSAGIRPVLDILYTYEKANRKERQDETRRLDPVRPLKGRVRPGRPYAQRAKYLD